jgi:WD40 repeat protein/serine/threonine protein kinase
MGQFGNIQLEEYRFIEQIGAGGFGMVFRAYQASVGREVALKIIRPAFASEPAFIRRFEREAQLIARLEHPFIVPLYDYWRDPEGAYLVMRWLRGGSLQERLRKRRPALTEAVDMLDQVAAALAVAHRNHIVHRDMKPSNILLDEDHNAYLSDFGIASDLALPGNPLAAPEAIVGSPDYLSPEQARGEPVTPQTDIYSLGVMLYEIVTGEHPFHELSSVERLYSHINHPLPAIAGVAPGAEDALNEVIQKATAKNPAQRYEDALALAKAFREAVTDRELTGALVAEQLTPREMDILKLLGEGLSNQEIADELVISLSTVKWYNQQIYGKLDVGNRVQAAIRARQLELIADQRESSDAPEETTTSTSYLVTPENPYKGLKAFQPADRDDFFGREGLVAHLLRKMTRVGEPLFLPLVGPSGSGKTSLIRAGLLPAVQDGRLPGSETWFTVDMVPGSHPLDTLEVALIKVASGRTGNLREQLHRDARGLVRAADLVLPDAASRLLLIVDQFEELFTLVDDEQERQHFLDLIATAVTAERSRLYVVLALRADYYDRPLRYPHFGELLRSRMETILPMGPKDLERAISGPAERVHVTFETGLVTQIASEMTYQAGALPLLQVAMRELFARRHGRVMTRQAYREIGGAVGALANRAESAFQGLDPKGRELTRQLFLRLAAPGEDVSDRPFPAATGRRVPREELLAVAGDPDLMDEIIDLFANYRLLALDHDPSSRQPTVELAHEALLGEWARLRDWLDDARSAIRMRRQLSRMASEWRQAAYDDSFLLRGSRLDQFTGWASNTTLRLTAAEQSYLDASLEARRRRQEAVEAKRQKELETAQQLAEQERKRAQEQADAAQQLRRRAILLAAALGLALMLSLATGLFAREASRQRANAQEQLALTRSRELALAALTNLEEDPELSILLALAALSETHTVEAEQTLHRALLADRLLLRLENGAITAKRVTFSPDGAQLATLALPEDGPQTLTVWDATSGEQQAVLSPGYLFDDFAFSPDGALLVTAPFTDTAADAAALPPVQLWDASSGRELTRLDLAGGQLHPWCGETTPPGFFGVDISPDGAALATIHCLHGEGAVAIWDIARAKPLLSLPVEFTPSEFAPVVRFSPDGNYLAASTGSVTITMWDSSSGEAKHVLAHGAATGGAVVDLAFTSDSGRLATAGLDGVARIWDVTTGEQLLALDSGSPEVWGVAFDPGDSRLATAAPDGTTRLWDMESGREVLTLSGAGERFSSVAFHPGGDHLATTDESGATLVWDLTATGEFFSAQANTGLETVAYLPDDTGVVAGGAGGGVTIWELASGRELASWQAHDDDHWAWVSVTPDGAYVASGGKADDKGQTKLWDAKTGELQWVVDEPVPVWKLDISPDGTRLALGSWDIPFVLVRDLTTGQLVYTATGTTFLSFDPQGERLAVADELGPYPLIRLLDAHSGETSLTIEAEAPGGGPSNMTFSPDGRRLAASSFGGQVTILDSSSGDPLLSIKAHDAPIWGLAYSPGGGRLATGGVDGMVNLWDAESGSLLLTLEGFDGAVSGIAFSADGSRLVASSYDGSVRGFLLDLDDLVALARSRVTRTFTPAECRQYLRRDTCAGSSQ